MGKTRVAYLDVARGIAILSVIISHIGVGKAALFTSSCTLEIFFFVSGLFFSFKDDFGGFLKKKVKTLMVPYVLCAVICAIYRALLEQMSMSQIWDMILLYIVQKKYTVLWFLPTLFIVNALMWIICKVWKSEPWKVYFTCLLLGWGFMLYGNLGLPRLPWNFDTACVMMQFTGLGYLFKKKAVMPKLIENKYRPIWVAGLGIISIGCTVINYVLTGIAYDTFENNYSIIPVTALAAATGMLAVILFSTYLEKIWPLEWLGVNSMTFFAFHIDIGLLTMHKILSTVGLFRVRTSAIMALTEEAVTILGVMFICWIIHWCIEHFHLGIIIGKA
ncbi:MAG: acyltransferase family protein [Lachnospiraceae bacterium]|nr:acyltransferase family protein [Lachnospiraceae bacterium]